MTNVVVTAKRRKGDIARLREGVAFGFLNYGNALETRGKANAPVAGGHRSFRPEGPVGGTLRRSIHTVVYLDGTRISPAVVDGNGQPVPEYVPAMGIVLYVGTNSGYGFWVHEGTTKMAARPFFTEAHAEIQGQAGALIAAGAKRKLGQ